MRIRRHEKSYIVELADGSAWRIWPGDMKATLEWTPESRITVSEIDDPFCTHVLIDAVSGARVRVIDASGDWAPEDIEAALKT